MARTIKQIEAEIEEGRKTLTITGNRDHYPIRYVVTAGLNGSITTRAYGKLLDIVWKQVA